MATKTAPMENIFQQYRHICSQLDCQPTPSYLSALRSQSTTCVIEQLSSDQSDAQLYALSATLPYSNVANLTLNRATAGVATWWSFFEAVRRTPTVVHLAVTNSTFDESKGRDRTMMDVGNKVGQLQLKTLDFSGTLLSSVLFQCLARGGLMRFQTLERLVVADCSLSDDTVRVMCNSIGSAMITAGSQMKLKDLILANNRISQIGALALARLLSGEMTDRPLKLRTLDVSGNQINDVGGEALAASLQTGLTLECLNMSNNPLGDSCLMELATIWRRTPGNLKELYVSGVGPRCTIQGSMAFLQGVARSNSLKVLDIRSLNLSSILVIHALGKLLSQHKDLQSLYLDIGGVDELRELMPAILVNKVLVTLWLGLSVDRASEPEVMELCQKVNNVLEGNAQRLSASGDEVKGLFTVFNHVSNQSLMVVPVPRSSVLVGDDIHASYSNGEVMDDIRARHEKQMGGGSSEGSSLLDTGSISGSLPSYVSEASFKQDSPMSSRRSIRRSDWQHNSADSVELKMPNLSVRTQRADLTSPRSLGSRSSSRTPSQKSSKGQPRSTSSGSGSGSPHSPLTPIDPWAPFSCTPRTCLSVTPRVAFTPRSSVSGITSFGKAPSTILNRPAGSVFGGNRAGFTPKTPFSVFGSKPRVPRPSAQAAMIAAGGPIPPAMAFKKYDKDDDMLLNMGEMVLAMQDTSILHGLPALKLSNYLQDTLDRMSMLERPLMSLPEFMQCYEAVCNYKTNHFRRQRAVRYPIGAGTNKALRRVFRAYSTSNVNSFMQAAHSAQQPIMTSEQFHQLCSDAGFIQPTGLLAPLTMDIIFAQCKAEDRTGLTWLDFLKACVMIGQDNETHFDAVESAIMATPIAVALAPPAPPTRALLEEGRWSPRSRTSRSPRSPASGRGWSPRSGSGSSYRSPRSPAGSFKRSPSSTPRSVKSDRRQRTPATLAAIKDQLSHSESDTHSENSLEAGEKLITCKFNQMLDKKARVVKPKPVVTDSDSSNALPEDLSESTTTPPAGESDSPAVRKSRRVVHPAPKVALDAPAWAASGAGSRRAAATAGAKAPASAANVARPPVARAPAAAPVPVAPRPAAAPVRAQPPAASRVPAAAPSTASPVAASARVASVSSTPRASSQPRPTTSTTARQPWNASLKSKTPATPSSPTKSTRSTRTSFSSQTSKYGLRSTKSQEVPAVSVSMDSGLPRLTAQLLASASSQEVAKPTKHAFLRRSSSTISAPAFCNMPKSKKSVSSERPAWNGNTKLSPKKPEKMWL